MNKQEASHVLQTIKELYPTFHLSQMKVAMLMRKLLPMDYEEVIKNVMKHVATHPYPPTIAEIAAYPKQQTEEIDKLRSEEHTSELQSRFDLVCRLLLEKKNVNDQQW